MVTKSISGKPSGWDQVSDFIDKHGTISNAEVRKAISTGDVLSACKHLRAWVAKGLLT
jgi:ATP-dependent DNA helicase RecG